MQNRPRQNEQRLTVVLAMIACAVAASTARALPYGSVTSQVQKGKTTQVELLQIFGGPNIATTDRDGTETWVYERSTTQTDVQASSQAAQGAASLGAFFKYVARTGRQIDGAQRGAIVGAVALHAGPDGQPGPAGLARAAREDGAGGRRLHFRSQLRSRVRLDDHRARDAGQPRQQGTRCR